MEWFLYLATGLVAGFGHVVSGPDHLAAVAPLVAVRPRRAWRLGFSWGIGHSGGVWLLAILALVFREALPIDALSTWGERIVGVVLIAIGLWGFRRLIAMRVHERPHAHAGIVHTHLHVCDDRCGSAPAGDTTTPELRHTHSALGVGALHGIAGTSHLLGVLPALLLPNHLAAVTYVVAYGVGAIASMTAFAWVWGLVANGPISGARLQRLTLTLGSFAAVSVGCWWLATTWAATGHD